MLLSEKELVLTAMRRWGSLKAQINKIDMSTPQRLAETDSKMIQELNTLGYFKYIFLTLFGKGFGDRIKKDTGITKPATGS